MTASLWVPISILGSAVLVWSARMTWLSMCDNSVFVRYFSVDNMIEWSLYGMRDALVFSTILYTQGALLYYFDALPRVCHIYFRCAAAMGLPLAFCPCALLLCDALYRAWMLLWWLVTPESTRYTVVGEPY